MCVTYARIILLAMPAFMLQNMFQSFLITAEKPTLGLIITVVAGVTNMILDALFKATTNGSSELVSNISMSFVSMLYNFQLMKYAGENGVAAYDVIMYVNFIFIAIFLGYSIGTAPIIGYNYGAGNDKELKNIFNKSIIFVTAEVLATIVSLSFIVKYKKKYKY